MRKRRIISLILLVLLGSGFILNNFALAQEYKICPYCGAKSPMEARYCIKCGRAFPSPQPTKKIIIQPDTFDDRIRYAKYLDWKKELEAANWGAGYGIASGIGCLGLAAVVAQSEFLDSGGAIIFGATGIVVLVLGIVCYSEAVKLRKWDKKEDGLLA